MKRVEIAYKALEDKFGKDIIVIDIHNVSTVADVFIIASGGSPAQIKAMCDEVIEKLEQDGLKLHHGEGMRSANWVLLDFGHIIIHIFDKENRQFYSLERIWSDGRVLKRAN
ncbi:MAG: ribosome silencing factor [Clostridiales bacterium]|nr:ribosome silencing factor [Clostridiales bacterium]